LSAEQMQALLDGDLSRLEAARLEAHVDDCARCRSEFSTWQVLFDDLGDLAPLAPSSAFRGRILDALPSEGSARTRARRATEATAVAGSHIPSGRLQDYLETRLAARVSARIDAHLDTCAVCRSELATLRKVSQALDAMGQLSPSPEFGLRVMAAWRVEQMVQVAMAPTTRWGHVMAWARSRAPSTRQGWAAVMGVATAPAVVLGLLIQSIFSSPLVTLGNLAAFARIKMVDVVVALSGQIAPALEAAGLDGFAGIMLDALSSPTVAAGAATVASGLTFAALWVVYRSLIASQPADRPYAHVSL
jgi:anti-sigma factor RsiW